MIRRILSVFSLSLFCVILLCACSKGGNTDPTVPDGAMIAVTEASGTITGYERYSYNSEGQRSRVDYFTADSTYDHYVVYEYDAKGRVILETTYAANGIGQFYYDYKYDDDGNYSQVMYVTQSEGYSVTNYENGAEKEKFSYDNKGNLLSHQEMLNGEWKETPYEETSASENE